MHWNRCLGWLLENYPGEEELFFLYGRNAFKKGRNEEGNRAFSYIQVAGFQKTILKTLYCGQACAKSIIKQLYLKIRH